MRKVGKICRKRQKERENQRERERKKKKERVCVCAGGKIVLRQKNIITWLLFLISRIGHFFVNFFAPTTQGSLFFHDTKDFVWQKKKNNNYIFSDKAEE